MFCIKIAEIVIGIDNRYSYVVNANIYLSHFC